MLENKGYQVVYPWKAIVGSKGGYEPYPAMSEGRANRYIEREAKRLGISKDGFSLRKVVPPSSPYIFIKLLSGEVKRVEI